MLASRHHPRTPVRNTGAQAGAPVRTRRVHVLKEAQGRRPSKPCRIPAQRATRRTGPSRPETGGAPPRPLPPGAAAAGGAAAPPRRGRRGLPRRALPRGAVEASTARASAPPADVAFTCISKIVGAGFQSAGHVPAIGLPGVALPALSRSASPGRSRAHRRFPETPAYPPAPREP